MARPKSIEESAETNKIDTHAKLEAAILRAQANIQNDPHPGIEVSAELLMALAAGRSVESLTYSRPAVRIFKEGTMDRILREEDLNNDDFYNLEIKKKNEAARK